MIPGSSQLTFTMSWMNDTDSGKADFVAKVVEATDAVLGILVVVVPDKAKAARRVSRGSGGSSGCD